MVKGALFVCLGNICRSPIADAVFLKIIKDRGVADQWKVDSAAIGGWHSGSSPDSRASNTLKNHNVPYNGRARQIKDEDFFEFDYIFGMDNNNISSLKGQQPPESKAKILLLGDFDPEGEKIIRDPYYAQHLIDATTAAFKAGKIANNPFAGPGKGGVAIPPPAQLMGQRPGAPQAQMMPGAMGPHGPMPPMMGMRPPMMGMMPMGPMDPMGPVRPPMGAK